jgi:hypothetical protein
MINAYAFNIRASKVNISEGRDKLQYSSSTEARSGGACI